MIFLVEQVLPAGYFDQTLRALSVDMAVLRDLLNQRLPKLAAHLETLQKSSGTASLPPILADDARDDSGSQSPSTSRRW